MLTCWYWEFKTGITICIGKTFKSLATHFTQRPLNTALNSLLRLTSIGWHFEVQQMVLVAYQELHSNNSASNNQSNVQGKHQMIAMNFQTYATYTQLEYV